jgi:hypothetical protein
MHRETRGRIIFKMIDGRIRLPKAERVSGVLFGSPVTDDI